MSVIFFMLVLFALVFFRALYLRKLSFVMHPKEACTIIGGWFVIAALLLYPLFVDTAKIGINAVKDNYFLLFIGFFKGSMFWVMSFAGQTVRKKSNSSAAFYGFICIGIIAFVNSFNGENLSAMQLVSVALLFLAGIYFVSRGHLSEQSLYIKTMFLTMIAVGTTFGAIDHYFLSYSNWYVLLFLTGVGISIVSIISYKFNIKNIVLCLLDRKKMSIGLVMAFSEVVILSILVVHVPVTLAWVAMTLSGPFVMLFSSLFWGEGNWKEQLLIGSIAYAAAIPIMLGL